MSNLPVTDLTKSNVWEDMIKKVDKVETTTRIEVGVLGNMNVGKTNLQQKYVDKNHTLPQVNLQTRGTDIRVVYVNIDGDLNTKVRIWDTAGQESHADIVGSYVKRLDACLMVFDLTKEKTFQSLFKWIKQLS